MNVPGSVSSRCVSCEARKQASEGTEHNFQPRPPVKHELTLIMRLGSCAAWFAAMLLYLNCLRCVLLLSSAIFVGSCSGAQQAYVLAISDCFSLLGHMTSCRKEDLLPKTWSGYFC
jgi:hypothetical protein